MYRCDDCVTGCLSGKIQRIGQGLKGNISLICSVSKKEDLSWRWDDRTVILWDNKEKVLIKKQ